MSGVLSYENNQYTTEINLSIPKRKINVKDTTDNVTKSIDRAVSKMAGRISKFKEKRNEIWIIENSVILEGADLEGFTIAGWVIGGDVSNICWWVRKHDNMKKELL